MLFALGKWTRYLAKKQHSFHELLAHAGNLLVGCRWVVTEEMEGFGEVVAGAEEVGGGELGGWSPEVRVAEGDELHWKILD